MKALLKKLPLLFLSAVVLRVALPMALLFAVFMPLAARAQGTPDAGTSDVQALADGAQTIIHVAQDPTQPKYLIIIAAVFVLCQLFKRFGHRVPVVGVWLLAHPWGDWIVGVVLALSGALMTSIPAGHGVDIGLILSALVTGMAASGTPLAIFGTGPTAPLPSDAAAQAAGTVGAKDPSKPLNS